VVALLEYQGKSLLAAAGLPVPSGVVVRELDGAAPPPAGAAAVPARMRAPEIERALRALPAGRLAVKAQVPAKDRAAAGGVVLVSDHTVAAATAARMLGSQVHRYPVRSVLIEEAVDIAAEWFVGVTIDPWRRGLVVRCSDQGGSGVEDRLSADRGFGYGFSPGGPPAAGTLASAWRWDDPVRQRVAGFAAALCRLAVERDLLLLEVNPLAVTRAGEVLALDAHVTADDDAEFRQPWLAGLAADLDTVHPARAWRRRYGGDFTVTDPTATVALLNTGAGAGMLLTDELWARGIRTYDFSDIRAGTPERREDRFAAAVDLILQGDHVDTVLICIHAGITDLREAGGVLARSVDTLRAAGRNVVLRLEGPHAEEASATLAGRPGLVVEADLRRAVEAAAVLTRAAS
jgi:succinyl-CoA synthetase beta subunit